MVNLLTGDFVYNMPLAEVPSPEGGFPINLFYHAGIKTHQEASNYGLGWGFNPGAISRSINGFPDDYHGEDGNTGNYKIYEDKYDSGTTTSTYTFGFTIPKTPFSVTFSETHNSQLGSFGSNALSIHGINALEFNRDPAGNKSTKFGSGLIPSTGGGLKDYSNDPLGWEKSGRQGLAPGFSSVSFSLKDGLKTTRVGKAGDWNIEITSKGFNLGIINFGTTTVRQWLDLSRPMRPFGSVMNALNRHNSQGVYSSSTLTMDLFEDRNSAREEDNTGGVHFAYDNYQVNSAKVGGSFRPIIYQNGSLMGRQFTAGQYDPNDNYYKLKAFDGYFDSHYSDPERVRFRYKGEFASKRIMPGGTIYQSNSTPTFAASNSNFINAPSDDPSNGFIDRYLKGGKYVEYFGELEMGFWSGGASQSVNATKKVKNFTYNRPVNYVGSQFDNSKIHAFKVTGEDGSEHHFGLPVFITQEESVAFETERWVNGNPVEQLSPANAYSKVRKNSAYAYSWLQTAILGADYIDRNDDGLTDPGDYGSYVRFAYGNHTKNKSYPYRAPYEGFEFEPSFSNKTATFGAKQLFYLNSIQTRTHTALFFHSVRLDGRGATKDGMNNNITQSNFTMTQLRTDKIVILKNEDLQTLLANGDLADRGVDWAETPDSDHDPYMSTEFNSAIQSKALQILDFNYSYDLCQQTTNSNASQQGKLTLTSVSKKGKGGSLILPSYNFDYDVNNSAANPDFDKHAFDRWGYYKGDIQLTGPTSYQYPVDRKVSCGNNDAAAWSLREIELPVGAKIKVDYEPDTYYRVGSSSFNFPYPDDYLMFRESRGFFTSNNGSLTIAVPNSAQGYDLRTALQTIMNNNGNVSLIVRRDSDGQERCDNSYKVQSIVYSGGNYNITFNSPLGSGLGSEWSIIALALVSNKFPHETICLNSPATNEVNGGGIRVNEIQLVNSSGQVEQKQEYTYVASGGTFSSGVVPYEPSAMDLYMGYVMFSDNPVTNTYSSSIGAEVNYGEVNVTIKNDNGDFLESNCYTFETFDQATHLDVTHTQSSYGGFDNIHTTTINDRTSQIGRPLSIERYNSLGHCNAKKIFEYYASAPASQGVTKEYVHSIRSRKRVFGTPFCLLDGYFNFNGVLQLETEPWKVLITEKNTYPSVLEKVRTISQGFETQMAYTDFDFFTGKTERTENSDIDGRKTIVITKPAYEQYPEMGSKVDDPTNRNMLTQETGNYVYKDFVSNSQITTASVQVWSEDDYIYRSLVGSEYVDNTPAAGDNIWRPYQVYRWKSDARPDGTVGSSYSAYNYGGSSSSNWIKTKEVTRYDRYSNALEEKNLNNTYSATKLGYGETLPLASASPSKYVEFAFSSGEDHLETSNYFGGEVKAPTISAISTNKAHTGNKSVRLNGSTQYGFNYQTPCRIYNQAAKPGEIERKKYEARVWIHQNNTSSNYNYLYCSYKDNSGNVLQWDGAKISDAVTIKAGEWYQLRLPIEINNSNLLYCTKIEIGTWVSSNSGDVYFDDFRFAPVDARINGYVYDEDLDLVTYVLDEENFFTQYVYDDAGRLIKMYRETTENPTGKRLVSESEFHYKRPNN